MCYIYTFGADVDFSIFFSRLGIHLLYPLSEDCSDEKVNNSELSDRCQLIFKTVLHLARKAQRVDLERVIELSA